MSETTEMMLDGTLCGCCGVYMGDEGEGFPRYCESCAPHYPQQNAVKGGKQYICPMPNCKKWLNDPGSRRQHLADKHGMKYDESEKVVPR